MGILNPFEWTRSFGHGGPERPTDPPATTSTPATPQPAVTFKGAFGAAAAAVRKAGVYVGAKPELSAGGEDSGRLAAPVVSDNANQQPRGMTGPGVRPGDLPYGLRIEPSRGDLNSPTPPATSTTAAAPELDVAVQGSTVSK